MTDSNNSQEISLATAVKNSIKPIVLIPLTATVFLSSYSYAIGLQEIQVKSNLGEPLNATVFLTNPPKAALNNECFTVLPKASNSNFPGINSASANLAKVNGGYAVNITSKEIINEPITSITLATNCSTLPLIERTYTMLIDPAGVQEERVAKALYTPRNSIIRSVSSLSSQNTPATAFVRANRSGIAQNSTYQIQSGDFLSSIAARVENTPKNSTWSVAASILATNPSAFVDNNPDYIIQGNTINIPSFTNAFVPNERAALLSISQANSSQQVNINQNTTPVGVIASAATPTRVSPVQTSNEALSTMTLSTSLSALSLQRIEARANGLTVSDSLLPNTTALFGTGQEEAPQSPSQVAAASNKEAVEPKVVYVDRPAYPSEIDQRINAGITQGLEKAKSENSFNFGQLITTMLGTLVGLGLLSWFFVRPFIKRRNRVAFIRTVRAHKKKSKHIKRNKQRKDALDRLPINKSVLATEIEEISNTLKRTIPDIPTEETKLEMEKHAAEIEAAFTGVNKTSPQKQEPNLDSQTDLNKQVVINKNNGPRSSNVAKEIYEVGTIDDTGELASLTMAFPELEAELNARLGGTIPDLGKDINTDKTAETMTVQFERPLEDMVDFELPGLIDNVEGDFEAVVKEGDFSSTMVFNEEIFKDDDSINPFDEDTKTSTTLSTEAIEADAETRVSEIMVDEDGLKASDFGLNDEDFPAEKEDNKYYESEAGIQTPTLNLSTQELEELGFADDDNIVPFANRKKSKNS